ncbi:MAG: UvrB/UvrC motif-containing protein [Lachnospiraceae bacterium]|nr:UvrB/UvrC motif-containing protein [Lachnospiraceae bacterium]
MLCEICKENEARITYTEIINGVKREQHLCESCAAKQSPFNLMEKFSGDIPFGNILSGLLQNIAKGMTTSQEKEVICGRCGMSASEFAKNGKLGCPECYSAFAPILEKNLKTVQGAVENKGKHPLNARMFEIPAGLSKDADAGTATGKEAPAAPGDTLGTAGTIDDIMGTPEKTLQKTGKKTSGRKKKPDGETVSKETTNDEIAELRSRMNRAVSIEDYEEAARLRDLLHMIEKK